MVAVQGLDSIAHPFYIHLRGTHGIYANRFQLRSERIIIPDTRSSALSLRGITSF
jgi:hypothetical protein